MSSSRRVADGDTGRPRSGRGRAAGRPGRWSRVQEGVRRREIVDLARTLRAWGPQDAPRNRFQRIDAHRNKGPEYCDETIAAPKTPTPVTTAPRRRRRGHQNGPEITCRGPATGTSWNSGELPRQEVIELAVPAPVMPAAAVDTLRQPRSGGAPWEPRSGVARSRTKLTWMQLCTRRERRLTGDGAFYRDEQDPRALPGDDLDRWFGTRRPNAALVERALGEGLSGVNWPASGRRSVAQTSPSFLSY